MTAKFVKFDPETGRILFAGEVPEDMLELQGDNVWVGEASPRYDYILKGQPTARPSMPATVSSTTIAADGASELTIRDVPAGSLVRLSGPVSMSDTTSANGDVTVTFAIAGEYVITIERFPFMEMKEVIHAI